MSVGVAHHTGEGHRVHTGSVKSVKPRGERKPRSGVKKPRSTQGACKKWATDHIAHDKKGYFYTKKCVARSDPVVPRGKRDSLSCADMRPHEIFRRRKCGEIGKKAHKEHRLAYLQDYYKKNKKEILERARKRREAKSK